MKKQINELVCHARMWLDYADSPEKEHYVYACSGGEHQRKPYVSKDDTTSYECRNWDAHFKFMSTYNLGHCLNRTLQFLANEHLGAVEPSDALYQRHPNAEFGNVKAKRSKVKSEECVRMAGSQTQQVFHYILEADKIPAGVPTGIRFYVNVDSQFTESEARERLRGAESFLDNGYNHEASNPVSDDGETSNSFNRYPGGSLVKMNDTVRYKKLRGKPVIGTIYSIAPDRPLVKVHIRPDAGLQKQITGIAMAEDNLGNGKEAHPKAYLTCSPSELELEGAK